MIIQDEGHTAVILDAASNVKTNVTIFVVQEEDNLRGEGRRSCLAARMCYRPSFDQISRQAAVRWQSFRILSRCCPHQQHGEAPFPFAFGESLRDWQMTFHM